MKTAFLVLLSISNSEKITEPGASVTLDFITFSTFSDSPTVIFSKKDAESQSIIGFLNTQEKKLLSNDFIAELNKTSLGWTATISKSNVTLNDTGVYEANFLDSAKKNPTQKIQKLIVLPRVEIELSAFQKIQTKYIDNVEYYRLASCKTGSDFPRSVLDVEIHSRDTRLPTSKIIKNNSKSYLQTDIYTEIKPIEDKLTIDISCVLKRKVDSYADVKRKSISIVPMFQQRPTFKLNGNNLTCIGNANPRSKIEC